MLDPKYFKVTAGQINVEFLNSNTQYGRDLGLDLTTIQEKQYAKGWLGAELVKNIQGWVLRSDSGLDNFMILAGSNEAWLYEEALETSKRWFIGDATKRYVFVRKEALNAQN